MLVALSIERDLERQRSTVEQLPAYADKIGTFLIIMIVAYAVHKDWLVTGGRYREVIALHIEARQSIEKRCEKLEAQIEISTEAQRVANETINKTASLVPELVHALNSLRDESAK